jgi:organic radical activating enzyme
VTAANGAPSLVVSEVFGPTIQGEGPSTGNRALFIRLGGCNLSCSWCDTPYTWDAKRFDLRAELTRRPVGEIMAAVRRADVRLVVITGGEPLLHQHQSGWPALLDELDRWGMFVEVETNGTVMPTEATIDASLDFNVSPKLAHSGLPEADRIKPDVLRRLAADDVRAIWKFVLSGPGDLAEVDALVTEYGIDRHKVWVMAEGTTPDAVLAGTRAIADPAIAAGFNVTTRLHTLVWGQERGR